MTKEECDHVQFLITEKSGPNRVQLPEIDDIETLSLGKKMSLTIQIENALKRIK